MIITTDHPSALLAWASDRIMPGLDWEPGTRAIGVLDEAGQIRAVAAYNMFYDGCCSAHIATDGSRAWANRGVLQAWFEYPFRQCGLSRMTAPVAADNVSAQILALKMGFSFEGRQRAGFLGKDVVLLGMLRSECRWIGSE